MTYKQFKLLYLGGTAFSERTDELKIVKIIKDVHWARCYVSYDYTDLCIVTDYWSVNISKINNIAFLTNSFKDAQVTFTANKNKIRLNKLNSI